jgi:hypothetical protein
MIACGVCKKEPWKRASFDGANILGTVVMLEICPFNYVSNTNFYFIRWDESGQGRIQTSLNIKKTIQSAFYFSCLSHL